METFTGIRLSAMEIIEKSAKHIAVGVVSLNRKIGYPFIASSAGIPADTKKEVYLINFNDPDPL